MANAVSIHALLAECDCFRPVQMGTCLGFNPRTPCGVRQFIKNNAKLHSSFQSTHSLRSATFVPYLKRRIRLVSIHALLAECDCHPGCDTQLGLSFNPRTPCGVRRKTRLKMPPRPKFQSTHSLRSATDGCTWGTRRGEVSIHALLAECDKHPVHTVFECRCFNPRTPCGVRPGEF